MHKLSSLAGVCSALLMAIVSSAPASAQNAASNPRSVCLRTLDVDHTQVVDDKFLIFHMRNGAVWRNQLKSTCPGLESNGFSERLFNEQICANAQTIQVLRTGQVCSLGDFTQDKPAK